MFFSSTTSEWGDVLLIPTKSGEALLTAIIALTLLLAMVFIERRGLAVSASKLAFLAGTIGVASLFSNIMIYEFPNGGTITLFSMLIITLPGYWYGAGAGVMTGIAYGVFQMLIDPYMLFPEQITVDYIFAFGALGISGFFADAKNGILKGYIAGVMGRYFFAVISGWIFFGSYAWEGWSPLTYSLVYNGTYLLGEALLTFLLLCLPFVRTKLEMLKNLAIKDYEEDDLSEYDIALLDEF